jgi:hypothetical protein
VKVSILKNMALLGLMALAAAASAASDDARAVRRLQEKAGSDSLVPVTASREEIALALAEVAATTGQPQADISNWSAKDYDALFALLQQYREELAALGLKQAAVDAAMDALRKRVEDLETRMEYLPPDGMKIHGGFNILSDDLLITGPGQFAGNATRFRHFKQYVDLEFTAIHGPFMGITQVDLANYVGSYAAPEPIGIRRVYAELRTPIAMQTGDFTIKYTPLTLWRNEDEDPYIPEPFKGRVERLRGDLLLADDHANLLRGLRFLTDIVMGETHTLEIEAYGSKIDGSGQAAYTFADPLTGADSVAILANADVYLFGWRVASELLSGWRLGYVGVKMFEEKDSGSLTYGSGPIPAPPPIYGHGGLFGHGLDAFDNEVHSVSTSFKFLDDLVSGNAEYAISRYANPNAGYFGLGSVQGLAHFYWNNEFLTGGYLPGTAMNASFSLGPKWAKLTGSMRQVDESFIAPGAQTRTLDRDRTPYGPFYTENSLLNPNGGYGGFTGFTMQDYPETQFNRRILPPASHIPSGYVFGYLLPSDVGFEAGSPYGLATPNRSGYGAQMDFSFWKGGFQPSVKVDMSQEILGEGQMYDVAGAPISGTSRPPEKYFMVRAGMIVDLKPMVNWPVKFVAGYRIEAVNGDGPWAPELPPSIFYPKGLPAAQVNFDSTRLDLGLEYYPAKSTGLFLGYRHLDYNGTIYDPNVTYQPRGQFGLQRDYETTGVGLRHLMGGDRIVIDLLYSNQIYPDRDLALNQGKAVAFEIEQIFSKISVRF